MSQKIKYLLSNFWEVMLSIPYSIIFNFKVLPFSIAKRCPVIISYHIRTQGVNRNNFIFENYDELRCATIRIGFDGSGTRYRDSKKGIINIEGNGKIIIKGIIGLSQAVIIEACDGTIVFGNHFRCNSSCIIYCKESEVIFGDEVVLGWHVTVKNGDGHFVVENGTVKPRFAPIHIGNHVWLCSYSDILKGVTIGDDSVVAYRSLVTKGSTESGLLFGGCPAKIIRNNINWKE